MKITLPAVAIRPLRLGAWPRRLALAAAFILTLFLTVRLVSTALGIVAPVAAADPGEISALLSDIDRYSSPVGANLTELGFTLDGDAPETGAAPAAAAVSPTPTKAATLSAAPAATAAPSATATQTTVTATATLTPTTTATATPALPSWDRKGRVNILLMGLDGTSSQGRFRRADSLIVASIDPATNSAVLIGIPRDTYVTINSPKGAIRNKINTAYVWGELYGYPGGGPALQMRTVGELLGIPIHHYVSVYFDGFAKLIDAIGGVDIDVQQAIRDNFTGWSFDKGMQHLDGKRALQFARSRYSTSDFSRGRRQQQVILAAIEKTTKAGIVAKLPAVLPTVSEAFRSDMSIPDLLSLASLGYKIDRSKIKTAQIDETMVTSYRAPDGASALLPKMDRVRAMVQSALTPPPPAATATTIPPTASPTITGTTAATTAEATAVIPAATATAPAPADYRSEQATIEVLNGTNTIGLARRTQTWLQGQGFKVTRIGDASGISRQTVLYHDGTKPATTDALIKLLGITPANVKTASGGGVNIRIVVGTTAKIP